MDTQALNKLAHLVEWKANTLSPQLPINIELGTWSSKFPGIWRKRTYFTMMEPLSYSVAWEATTGTPLERRFKDWGTGTLRGAGELVITHIPRVMGRWSHPNTWTSNWAWPWEQRGTQHWPLVTPFSTETPPALVTTKFPARHKYAGRTSPGSKCTRLWFSTRAPPWSTYNFIATALILLIPSLCVTNVPWPPRVMFSHRWLLVSLDDNASYPTAVNHQD